MSQDLIKLKDDEEYYRGVGKKYLSNSNIKALLGNVKDFGVNQPDNPVFAKGRLFHQIMLEPEKAKDCLSLESSTRNTKKYQNFCSDNELDFILLNKEVDDIKSWTDTMKSNMDFFDLIYAEGNEFEVPSIKEIKGKMWKGKADIVGKDVLIDLKTTSDITKFKRSANIYHYDSQAYIYQELFGKPLIFLVIDKITQALGIFRPSEDFIKRGEQKVERAVEVHEMFFGKNATENIDDYYTDDYIE